MSHTLFGGGLITLVAIAVSADAAEVRLRSSAAVRAPIVRLADVAEIFADDPAVADGLSLITLCPAPGAGSERSISQHELRQILLQSGIERQMVLVTGSERVTLLSDARPLQARPIQRSFDSVEAIQPASFLRVEPPAPPPSKTTVAQPAPQTEAAEPPPRLVDRGTNVTVLARTAGVRVTTSGKALAHGAVGETIAVELDDSREKVLARVVGPHTVEVAVGRSFGPNKPLSVPLMEATDE
jgi:flagella basal body P-ring formation protein FlgA